MHHGLQSEISNIRVEYDKYIIGKHKITANVTCLIGICVGC